jgi:hypothetical protein
MLLFPFDGLPFDKLREHLPHCGHYATTGSEKALSTNRHAILFLYYFYI